MDRTRSVRRAAVGSAKMVQAVGKAARKVLNPGGGNYENVRVENIDHFIDYFRQPATHVYIPRPAYDHHFLIKSAKFYEASQKLKVKIIHYRQILIDPTDPEFDGEVARAQAKQDGKFNGVVGEDSLEVILSDRGNPQLIEDTAGYFNELYNGNWHVVIDPDYPETEEDRDEAVERAERRIGEKRYKIFSNNCETFVTEVLKPGQGCSHQAANAARYLKKVVKSSAVASGAVIAALLL